MSSKAVMEKLPRLLKSAASLGTDCLSRRFLSTDAASSVEGVAKAVSGAASAEPTNSGDSPVQTTPSNDKRGGRRGSRYSKVPNQTPKNNAVAAAVAADNQDNEDDESGNIRRVTTRLVDNHPLTEEDRDPHYYLSHLTKDQLDPDIPVFEEERKEFPDVYSETRKVTTTDMYGHQIVEIQHIPSKREQELNSLGFMFPDEDMFGVNHFTPPVIGNSPKLPESGNQGRSRSREEDDSGSLESVQRDGELLEGTPLKPGTDKQMELDYHNHIRNTYAHASRRQHRRLELGYDYRDVGNSQPWVDTHRIEAIDARLRDLHEQRDDGTLDYPLEKDAAMEAERIRAEEKEAIETIRKAIGVKGDEPLGDSYLFKDDDKKPGVQTRGRYVNRRLVHKPVVSQPLKNDPELDAMDVYSIPVEKLYQARRQELDRIRSVNYEDYDLSYLLQKSGKPMDRSDGARSLYEKRHGHSEMNRLPTEEEKENPIIGAKFLPKYLTGDEKAELGQKLVAYEKYSKMNPDQVMLFYSPYLHVLTPEMIEAEKKAKEEKDQENASSPNNLFEKPVDYNPSLVEGSEATAPEAQSSQFNVNPEMDQLQRDPNKPLQDYEIALNEQGDVMFAWSKNGRPRPDYLKDKEMFVKGVEDVIRTTEVSEEEKKKCRDMKLEQKDIEEMRTNMGQPEDLSKKAFHKRYLRGMRRSNSVGNLVTEAMTGYSLDHPEVMLKDLGLDTEEGVEDYLMDTFRPHHENTDLLITPEQKEALKLVKEATKVMKETQEMIAAEKKENEPNAPAEAEKKEGETTAKAEGDAPASSDVPAAETKDAVGETSAAPDTPDAPDAEAKTDDTETPAAEKTKEATTKLPEADSSNEPNYNPYEGMPLLEAYQRLQDRYSAAREEANKEVPSRMNHAISSGHLVDALEHADQVYVHERDRELILRLYQQGMHPKEISKTFGFVEDRVYAILRLMKARETHKKNGTYSDTVVKEFEEKENVFVYDYRDMPPAKYRSKDTRREGKVPPSVPRFVFLEEEEEEAKVMREIDRLVHKRRHEQAPKLNRTGLTLGQNSLVTGLPKHTYKLAIMDISKGAKKTVVISDHDGRVRQPTEEEKLHRSWNRHNMRSNEYLMKMGL